jgi:hypothetical protein
MGKCPEKDIARARPLYVSPRDILARAWCGKVLVRVIARWPWCAIPSRRCRKRRLQPPLLSSETSGRLKCKTSWIVAESGALPPQPMRHTEFCAFRQIVVWPLVPSSHPTRHGPTGVKAACLVALEVVGVLLAPNFVGNIRTKTVETTICWIYFFSRVLRELP